MAGYGVSLVTCDVVCPLHQVSGSVRVDRDNEAFSAVPQIRFHVRGADASGSDEDAWAGIRLPSLLPLDASRQLGAAASTAAGDAKGRIYERM